jgi:hypothetical protein
MIATEYYNLYTNLYFNKPKAMATLKANIEPLVHVGNTGLAMLPAFDVALAVGQQLDIIGLWVGMPRTLEYRIASKYFTHDGTALEGWNNGVWYTAGAPTNNVTTLGDSEYRQLLSATIARNNGHGTVSDAYKIILAAYPLLKASLKIVDNQNMTIRVNYDTTKLNSVQIGLLEGLVIPFKPLGVKATFNS